MLLDSADAFEAQVANYRSELFIHCYRMMGSVDEAEDALQEALTRAWQGRETFRRSISVRAWLYRIATNVCLNALELRKRDRVEPSPCPDDLLTRIPSPEAGPEARYAANESVSLAFLTVLQVLPPRQRAVLLLRDVLAFRSAEVAGLLETTAQAVNSSLERARTTLRERYSRRSHSSIATAGRSVPPNLLERYLRAWEAADVSGLVALLREDAALAMPPRPMVVGARRIGEFLAESIFPIAPMRLVEAHANQSDAFAAYMKDPNGPRYLAFALLVIEGDGHLITQIYAYSDQRVLARLDLPVELAG
jgi:RNA polymerase sigma-70 factor (ECF subfamily)